MKILVRLPVKLTTLIQIVLVMTTLSACSSSINNQPKQVELNKQSELGPYQQMVKGPSVVSYPQVDDPWRSVNEPIFKFNHVFYRYALSPLSRGYNAVVPDPVDNSIGNFFNNLREPLFALNHLFQGQLSTSGKSVGRFLLNSTLGVLGLFDPADAWFELKPNKTTFSNTLAYYGVGQGAYLVLPVLGPSNYRDMGSFTFDYLLHPINQINDKQSATAIRTSGSVHDQLPFLANYPEVLQGVEDPYEFVRNLYMQTSQRDAQFYQNKNLSTAHSSNTAEQQTSSKE
ncbi:surface lipoprotein-like protein [Catenovulum agarivorans DS-2]|uniref:Surface lipoprotein-like protein n=1 Tax=Catenovulum agarivorans DS-2 TaxID=1328313 RepID=W7QSL1_9ALTE|nr:VacJ family lipoprotein [Catenovulum agarivorans]EWH10858.1 surface lipoprotein-like protein [Catenovulum agarivorans DS-2]